MERKGAMPYDGALERAVIGDMLVDGEVAAQVAALADPEDFYESKNRETYRTLTNRLTSGASLDVLVLISQAVMSQIDYAGYVGSTDNALSWRHHVQILREMRQRRCFIKAAYDLKAAGDRWDSDVSQTLQNVWAELGRASRMTLAAETSPDRVLDAYVAEVQGWDGVPLAKTDIEKLDAAIGGGMLPGELLAVVGGDGSMKTSLALRVCDAYLANVGRPVLYLSLDMHPKRIGLRRLLPFAGVGEKRMVDLIRQRSPLFEECRQKRAQADRGLFHLVGGAMTLKDIEAVVAQLNPGLVVWDYLTATLGFKNEMDCQRACVERLREWQYKYPATWMVLSQMSEMSKAGQRQGDFAGKAAGGNNLARDADTLLELYLDEPPEASEYQKALGGSEPPALIAIVSKCRSGQKGSTWSLDYDGPTMSFTGAANRVHREKQKKAIFTRGF